MAREQKQQESAPAAEAVPEVVEPQKSYRLQITLALVCLILFQMIILWLLLPSRNVIQANFGLDVVNGTGEISTVNPVPPNLGPKEELVEKPVNE
jgi:hypothetical protein